MRRTIACSVVLAACAVIPVFTVTVPDAQSGVDRGTIREIQFADAGQTGTLSPNGRYTAFRPPAPGSPASRRFDLAVRDLRTNEVRTWITHTETAHIGGAKPVAWSSDNTRLAFAWCYPANKMAATVDNCEVRTIGLTDTTPKTLVPRFQGLVELYSWSPDDRSILALIRQKGVRRVVLISAADGNLRDVPVSRLDADEELGFPPTAFSPDGRFIAYSREPWQEKPFGAYLPADIFILSMDDGDDRPLIEGPDNEHFVAWTRDGSVLLTTNRSGTVDLMRAKTVNGRIVGVPSLVRQDVGQIVGQALTSDGRLFYETGYHEQFDVQVADIDPSSSRITSEPRNIPAEPRRMSTPTWIDNGRILVYRTAPLTPTPMFITDGYDSIAIRDAQSGKTRTVQLQHRCRDSWHYWTVAESPVPDTFLISVLSAPASCRGLYVVDTNTGLTTALVEGAEYVTDAQYLPGGKELLYVRGNQMLMVRSLASGTEKVIVDTRSITGEFEGVSLGSVTLSHNGRRVAARVVSRSQQAHLVEVSLTDGKLRQIPGSTRPKTPGSNPVAWTADDTHLLYVEAPQSGQPGAVWRISAAGGTPESIGLTIDSTERITSLAVHPGGRQIAFQRERTVRPKLFVLEDFLSSGSVRGGGRR